MKENQNFEDELKNENYLNEIDNEDDDENEYVERRGRRKDMEVRSSTNITKEMQREFWKHDLNPITGLPNQTVKNESTYHSSYYLDSRKP